MAVRVVSVPKLDSEPDSKPKNANDRHEILETSHNNLLEPGPKNAHQNDLNLLQKSICRVACVQKRHEICQIELRYISIPVPIQIQASTRLSWRKSRFGSNVVRLDRDFWVRVEFLLKTDSGYPKDTGVTLFTLATPGNPLRYNTHRSAPPVSALTHSRRPRVTFLLSIVAGGGLRVKA